MSLKINDKLVRKGISKEVYYIKAEKYVNIFSIINQKIWNVI